MSRDDLPEDVFAPSKGLINGAIGGLLIWVGLAIIGWRFVAGVL